MNISLSRRLAAAFLRGTTSWEEKKTLVDAAQEAASFEALPEEAKGLLLKLEGRLVDSA